MGVGLGVGVWKLCSHPPRRGPAPGLGPLARAARVRAQSSVAGPSAAGQPGAPTVPGGIRRARDLEKPIQRAPHSATLSSRALLSLSALTGSALTRGTQ